MGHTLSKPLNMGMAKSNLYSNAAPFIVKEVQPTVTYSYQYLILSSLEILSRALSQSLLVAVGYLESVNICNLVFPHTKYISKGNGNISAHLDDFLHHCPLCLL